MDQNILFSIVIPTFNRGNFIRDTISIVLKQELTSFEIIVVDDGSTDDTQSIVGSISDERIRYFKKENGERGAARNFGIKKAVGKYVTFLDSDDGLHTNHLTVARAFTEKHDNPPIFHLGYEIRNESGQRIGLGEKRTEDINFQLLTGNVMSCMGVFVRHDIINQHVFREDREMAGSEDWELWMRIACHHKILHSKEVTSYVVQHQERSVININHQALTKRIVLAYDYLVNYEPFRKKYGRYQDLVLAHLYLYIALHLIMAGVRTHGLLYWIRAASTRPSIIFHKKTAGIVKTIIKSLV